MFLCEQTVSFVQNAEQCQVIYLTFIGGLEAELHATDPLQIYVYPISTKMSYLNRKN